MKRFGSILLVLLIGLTTFKGLITHTHFLITHTHFLLNQAKIEKEECVNKDKPKLNCHGHCYLEKELKKDFEEDELPNTPNKKFRFKTISLITTRIADFSLGFNSETVNEKTERSENLYQYLYAAKVLGPPIHC